MKVCIYARVDSYDQALLDMQIKALREYAMHNGHTVTSVVSTLGTSGTANQQKSLQTILDMARGDNFDAVLAANPSRFSRDTFTCIEFLEGLKAHGKTVCYPSAVDDMSDVIPIFKELVREAGLK